MFTARIEARLASIQTMEESAEALDHLLSDGYAIMPGGELGMVRQQVGRMHGLRISIYADEHPPPHFHVKGGEVNATFAITDCSLLKGSVNGKDRELVEWWFARSRPLLVKTWNATRPTDCAVGPITD